MRGILLILMVIVAAPELPAQQINLQDFDRLAARATNVVEVNLDGAMLKVASAFLSERNGEEAAAQRIISVLKGIYVRVFEFDRSGAYSPADVEQIREQVRGAQWMKTVTVREAGGDNIDLWMHQEAGNITGLVAIVAEPQEVVVVNIVGPIRPEDLEILGGQFGIPRLERENR